MSRGPRPRRALDTAIPIAQQRGIVQVTGSGPELLYDFTIVSAIPVAFVRVKYAGRILATLPDIAADFHEAISRLRSIAYDAAISHELWLCSKHGTLRFFSVTADSLIELGRDGKPLEKKE
jgi:hypothetical protein